uniref:Uncharacterized protein n=1 Tax=Romanomermis culicivorax TaxID=13658 RepID=A0A915L017_ROMCU
MSNQRGTAQLPSATHEIRPLQSEMAWLTAHIPQLMAQLTALPPRNPMPSRTPSARVQNAGDSPSGAHLQMCSYHRRCTHNEASCWAQHSDSASPSNTTTTGAGRCYFCQTRGHGLPTSDSDNACCRSGFGTDSVVRPATAATDNHDAGQRKPVNEAKNDWRCQHGCVVLTDGSSGCHPPPCGMGEPQCIAHSSCCPVTINKDDRSPNTGGDCPATTSGGGKIAAPRSPTPLEKRCPPSTRTSVSSSRRHS